MAEAPVEEEEIVEHRHSERPAVPFKTAWGCTPTSRLRKLFMKLAVNLFFFITLQPRIE